jgi:SAM-dependent methyltransferase
MTSTHQLCLTPEYPFTELNRTLSTRDTMYGGSDAHYLSVGLSALGIIEEVFAGVVPQRILDLPSGFGRVTRVLRARFPHAAITACDLDREAVEFCALQFGARPVVSEKNFNHLRLDDEFDLIWVGSLITHLPPQQTRDFFAAMSRHMTSSSKLLVSSHGPSIIPRLREVGYGLAPEAAAGLIYDFEAAGFGYRDYTSGGDEYGVALTNEHYGISLTCEAWFGSALPACGLKLETYKPRVWDDHHDVVVARLAGTEQQSPTKAASSAEGNKGAGVLARLRRWIG